jgi:ferredoxin
MCMAIEIFIDGIAAQVSGAENLLQACLQAGRDVPYFCWHPALGSVGACRQCAVKIFSGPQDSVGKIVMSCMTKPEPGMRVEVADPQAVTAREAMVEFVLANHPHDCPVCEVGGECHLQDVTVMTGHHARRATGPKRTHQSQNLGPLIRHEMNRCIGCYRCVRFYQDYAGGVDFGVFGTAQNVFFGRAEDGKLASPFAGNLVEVCPTGVFVDKPFSEKFRRKWDMRATPSVCPHCAVGCNISVQERDGRFRRVVNRFNPTLNGFFLCDRGLRHWVPEWPRSPPGIARSAWQNPGERCSGRPSRAGASHRARNRYRFHPGVSGVEFRASRACGRGRFPRGRHQARRGVDGGRGGGHVRGAGRDDCFGGAGRCGVGAGTGPGDSGAASGVGATPGGAKAGGRHAARPRHRAMAGCGRALRPVGR